MGPLPRSVSEGAIGLRGSKVKNFQGVTTEKNMVETWRHEHVIT